MINEQKQTWRNELVSAMKNLTKEGFECYIYQNEIWGYIITPQDNVIYIQRDTYQYRGWSTSLKYVPSQKSGSGCRCEEEPFQKITKEQILLSEKEGLKFAKKLKAPLYESSMEWYSKFWNTNKLEKINERG